MLLRDELLLVPEVPDAVELEPVELVPVDAEPEPVVAFVKMNDAPELDPDPLRDAVDPLVPVVLPASPRCRQPVTVIVPVWVPDREVVCRDGSVLVCAATSAAHATLIANVAPTRFIYASLQLSTAPVAARCSPRVR